MKKIPKNSPEQQPGAFVLQGLYLKAVTASDCIGASGNANAALLTKLTENSAELQQILPGN